MTPKQPKSRRSKFSRRSPEVENPTTDKPKKVSRKNHLKNTFVIPEDPFPRRPGELTYMKVLEPLGLAAAARSGDEYAVGELLLFASQATKCLEELANEQPDLIKPLARRRAWWPVMCAPPNTKPNGLKNIASFLAKIELGAETSRKAASPKVDVWRSWAVPIVRFMDLIRRRYEHFREDLNLPPEEADVFALKLAAHYARKLNSDLPFGDVRISVAWLKDCTSLPPYTKETSKIWARLASSLIDLNTAELDLKKTSLGRNKAVEERAKTKYEENGGRYEQRLRETIHEKFSRVINTDAPAAS